MMRVLLLHHPADAAWAKAVRTALPSRGFEPVTAVDGAEVVLALVGRAAIRDGLGATLREALGRGLPVLPVLIGDDALPPELPVHRKHVPLARDPEAAVQHLLEHRERGEARQIDSKRALFGLGVLLALLQRT
jgi:hypothetical protein